MVNGASGVPGAIGFLLLLLAPTLLFYYAVWRYAEWRNENLVSLSANPMREQWI